MQKHVETTSVEISVPLGYSHPNAAKALAAEKLRALHSLIGGTEFVFHVEMHAHDMARLTIIHTNRGLPGKSAETYCGPKNSTHRLRSGAGVVAIRTMYAQAGSAEPGIIDVEFKSLPTRP